MIIMTSLHAPASPPNPGIPGQKVKPYSHACSIFISGSNGNLERVFG